MEWQLCEEKASGGWEEQAHFLSLACCACMCVWLTTKTAWRFYISWDLRVECVPAGLYLEHRALISEKDIYSTSYSCSDNNPKPPGTCTHTRPHARTHAHTHAGTTSTLPHSASLFTVESHHTAARCSLLFLPLCHSALCSHSHYCTAQIPPECCPRSLSRSSPSLSASTRTALTPCPPPSSARNIKHDSTRVSGWPAAKTNPVMWPSGVCPYRFWRKDHFLGFFLTVTDGTGCVAARKWTIPSPAVPSNLYARGQTALHIWDLSAHPHALQPWGIEPTSHHIILTRCAHHQQAETFTEDQGREGGREGELLKACTLIPSEEGSRATVGFVLLMNLQLGALARQLGLAKNVRSEIPLIQLGDLQWKSFSNQA